LGFDDHPSGASGVGEGAVGELAFLGLELVNAFLDGAHILKIA
jgi:hypothetical protein